jgi:hypothetical protein
VIAEDPKITCLASRRLRQFRNGIFIGEPLNSVLCRKQSRKLVIVEAD